LHAVLARTFERAYPDLLDDAEIRGERVGQALGNIRVVLAAAGPVGGAEVNHVVRHERVLDGLVGEVVGAGGADAAHDEVRGGLAGDERAGEVGVGRVLPIAGPALGDLAGLARGVRRRRRRRRQSGHHDRAGEAGGLRTYLPAQVLAEFVHGDCTGGGERGEQNSGGVELSDRPKDRDDNGELGSRKRTESAPGAGDGGDAGEVRGVVEELEDGGGDVRAEPVEEVPPDAVLRLHRAHRPDWKPMPQDRGGAGCCARAPAAGRGPPGRFRSACRARAGGGTAGGEVRAVEEGSKEREASERRTGPGTEAGEPSRVPGRRSFARPLLPACLPACARPGGRSRECVFFSGAFRRTDAGG
jgi:hypothetical protein